MHSFNVDRCEQTLQPNSFVRAVLIGIVDLIVHHLQWPWPWMRITRSVESKSSWLVLLLTSLMIKMKFDVVLKQLKLNILVLLQIEIYRMMENNFCFC